MGKWSFPEDEHKNVLLWWPRLDTHFIYKIQLITWKMIVDKVIFIFMRSSFSVQIIKHHSTPIIIQAALSGMRPRRHSPTSVIKGDGMVRILLALLLVVSSLSVSRFCSLRWNWKVPVARPEDTYHLYIVITEIVVKTPTKVGMAVVGKNKCLEKFEVPTSITSTYFI